MELPKLGEHCSQETCNRLDFLPMKCDACKEIFCKDHVQYAKHNCKNSYMKDVQVPVCPLCNQPVPTKRGQPPDITVGEHIDRYCQSDPAVAKRKIYTNKCSLKGCKQKEVVKISCGDCKRTFCLKHRLPQDHECQKVASHQKSVPQHVLATSGKQQVSKKPSQYQNKWNGAVSTSAAGQATMTEDEAMALAIQQSLLDNSSKSSDASLQKQLQEEEDRLLAQALAASERNERNTRSRQSNQPEKNSCLVS